jgi:protein TonB
MEEARPATGVSAAPTSAHPGGGGQSAHEGRPLVVYSGSAGNSEHLLSQLRARIERSLVYPPLARKRKMEGTATVSFVVGDGGVPAELRLVRSSGHRLLDDEAMNTVRRASPLPMLKGTVEIPIRFSLSEKG